jgi:ATP adenylyltransferase
MLERLFSTWREAYVTSVPTRGGAAPDREAHDEDDRADDSVFTQILRSGLPDEATHIVHRGEHCFAICNIFPYASGHLLVLPYREVTELDELTVDETVELWATVTDAAAALKRAYRPHGMNIGVNLGRASGGSVPTHLHVHLVPRWVGDSNFMSAVAGTQTLPESIPTTAAKIRAAWDAAPVA